LLLKVIIDVLEQSSFAMLVCVLIAIASGTRLSLLLLATLSVFFVLGALNTYWGYAAERHGRPAVKHYRDAIANVLACVSIYSIFLLFGLSAF
jgi:uncharacterized membrane protein YqjE